MHVPDAHRKKLDDKSIKCIFLGVSDETKGYRLYNPITKKILVSKDVVFDEFSFWNWNEKLNGNSESHLDNNESDSEGNQDEGKEIVRTTDEDDSGDNTFVGNNNVGHNSDEDEADNSELIESEEVRSNNEKVTKSGRTVKLPAHFGDYALTTELVDDSGLTEEENIHSLAVLEGTSDPICFSQAVKQDKWRKAMDNEILAIERNDTWSLVELPRNARTIGVKWIYKTKYNERGEIEKCKARLVAKGYAQQHGIDYSEVFAPVARWDTIRCILALAAQRKWSVYQLDVKSAFLHGELEETVFIDQPEGYKKKGKEEWVYRLKKALYGLKQAPRAWYSKIESYFVKEGFKKCSYEHTLFTKTLANNDIIIISLYVDDVLYTGSNIKMINDFRESMKKQFDMTDLGKMKHFLGVEVTQNTEGTFIVQQRYANEILHRFNMQDCKPVTNPVVTRNDLTRSEDDKSVDTTVFKQMVGSMMYLNATRPDLTYAVSLISRYMDKPTEKHLIAAKRMLRYLKGTTGLGIHYKSNGNQCLMSYCDSDYAGDAEDRKSTTGFTYILSNGAVSWSSKKQPIVTLSSTEAEYVAAAYCVCQGVWLMKILAELGMPQEGKLIVLCDNISAIKLSKNPIMHGRTKHIDVRYHFLRNLSKDGVIELKYCNTHDQVADLMTKAVKNESFLSLRKRLGMRF